MQTRLALLVNKSLVHLPSTNTSRQYIDIMSMSGGYDFSHLYHSSITAFSPGSTFLATARGRRVIIRSTTALSIVRTFQCLSGVASSSKQADNITIDQLLWSSDSLYILAFSGKVATAWIFGLTEEGNGEGGEVARIGGEGVEGLVRVEWGRGGREILAWSDYGVSRPSSHIIWSTLELMGAAQDDHLGPNLWECFIHPTS